MTDGVRHLVCVFRRCDDSVVMVLMSSGLAVASDGEGGGGADLHWERSHDWLSIERLQLNDSSLIFIWQ